jgi:hypothetical protein
MLTRISGLNNSDAAIERVVSNIRPGFYRESEIHNWDQVEVCKPVQEVAAEVIIRASEQHVA